MSMVVADSSGQICVGKKEKSVVNCSTGRDQRSLSFRLGAKGCYTTFVSSPLNEWVHEAHMIRMNINHPCPGKTWQGGRDSSVVIVPDL